jgi:hypothetical protein
MIEIYEWKSPRVSNMDGDGKKKSSVSHPPRPPSFPNYTTQILKTLRDFFNLIYKKKLLPLCFLEL